MAAGATIAAIAIGGGAAVALVVYSRKKAAAADPSSNSSSDPCAMLKNVNATAYDACRAAAAVGGIFGAVAEALGPQWGKKDAENKRLNGDVEIPNAKGLSTVGWPPVAAGTTIGFTPIQGSVLRFKNGCVPFVGAKGYEKCAPGTASMWGGNGGGPPWGGDSSQYTTDVRSFHPITATDMLSGKSVVRTERGYYNPTNGALTRSGDPTTGPVLWKKYLATHPLPVPPGGEAGWYRGVPYVCPAGQTASFVAVDPTTPVGAKPACVPKARTEASPWADDGGGFDWHHPGNPFCDPATAPGGVCT